MNSLDVTLPPGNEGLINALTNGADDPLAHVLQLLLQRDHEPAEDMHAPQEDQRAVERDAIARLARLTKRLTEELRVERRRVHLMAAALDACPDCWGHDPSCPLCEGDGAPAFLTAPADQTDTDDERSS